MSEENANPADTNDAVVVDAPTVPDAPAPNAPAAPAAAPAPADAPASTNWRDGIADENLRSVAERFSSPSDAIKAVADLRKQVSTSIRVPGKDASAEDVQKFYKALGVPDAPEGYQFQMPEGKEATDFDKAFQSRMAKIFHETGISAQAASKLNVAWNEIQQEAEQSTIDADKLFTTQSESHLKQEWGQDYQRNVALASRAAADLFDDMDSAKKIEMKDGRFLLDHPIMVKMLAKVGGEMAEDGFRRMDAGEASTLKQQADGLAKQKFDAYNKGDRALANQLAAQEQKLLERIHGKVA